MSIGHCFWGSPPRTWGKRLWIVHRRFNDRFTPTHVGKARLSAGFRPHPQVHPHARGESAWTVGRARTTTGSPPRTWGKHQQREGVSDSQRFTPTHVGKASCCLPSPQVAAVHPHARGESRSASASSVKVRGSPPRTWGKHRQSYWRWQHSGFTPTHVGKALALSHTAGTGPVHPHARGESPNAIASGMSHSGSPPRTWGKRLVTVVPIIMIGFTPTHVGKASDKRSSLPQIRVHPHARGESRRRQPDHQLRLGSPPRTWGKRNRGGWIGGNTGFTPTHVGKARARLQPFGATAVHPHARGESPMLIDNDGTVTGSPPRTWGKRLVTVVPIIMIGFTPTHVGKASDKRSSLPQIRVHPHARGESRRRQPDHQLRLGSPPRTWGKRNRGGWIGGNTGFTPTHVGKARARLQPFGATAVHPHARGESPMLIDNDGTVTGSPPRTWGKRDLARVLADLPRFTPTHVGKALPPVRPGRQSGVHPHARGESQATSRFTTPAPGSPPRTWGKHRRAGLHRLTIRFTPTHVGKAKSRASSYQLSL